jgi:hypothetical protein
MLKIVSRPEFEQKVVVNTKHLKGEFVARFVALPQSEISAIEAKLIAERKGPQDLVHHVCVGHDTVDMLGEAVEYSAGGLSLTKLLDYPGIGPAMLKAYYAGLWEEASGN